jgi:iron complex outermembrane receptor protein
LASIFDGGALGGLTLHLKNTRERLLATTIICGAALAIAAPAFAQQQTAASPGTTTTTQDSAQPQEVIVTGSILRHKLSDTSVPVTAITADDLQARGIDTVTDGIQQIAAGGSSGLPNSFTAQGAFAAGAANVSLRGLTSNSTLTLVDGLRMTYYPLADDGTRNFVDLNTIPDVIVDRIETLKDGGSATYGADAIAGVVNVITKKTYEGVTVKAEAGDSQAGGGSETNFQALVGYGNLKNDGYNVYVGVEYQHDAALYNRDRGYPYNTADLSSSCGVSLLDGSRTCRANGITNGLQFDNTFEGVSPNNVAVGRAVINGVATGDYQLIGACGGLKTVTISPQQAVVDGFTNPVTLCQQDLIHDYGEISPDDKRFSVSIRATKELPGNAQAYFAATYYQNDVLSRGAPSSIQNESSPGPNGLAPYNTYPGSANEILLPVYVCASGVNCNASNGTLNPNNPFAALGQQSEIFYRFGDIPVSLEQLSQTYRFAAGVNGDFNWLGKWHYDVQGTASQSDLTQTNKGYIYIANMLNAVATGAYNFVNPALNSQAVRNFISPTDIQHDSSQLAMIQAELSRDLIDLPGGTAQLGLLASIRYESIYDPSGNPDSNGATDRYFTANGFGAIGSRTTESVGFEVDAPVLKQLSVTLDGRYDTYSTGVDNFAPKITGRIRPFADWAPQWDIITFRSSYSTGFRIPSFAEANSFPTTGYTGASVSTLPAATLAAFEAAHSTNGVYDNYGSSYSLGLTETANPKLKPEYSDNFTVGVVLEPIRQLSFSFDFYRIAKRDVIVGDTTQLGDAITAYYTGAPIPAGYSVTAGPADPNNPTAKATLGFVSYPFANLDSETTSGYDFGATARFNLPYGIKYTSVFDGDYVLRLNLVTPDGTQHYAGTIGPYINVSASGTPKFRANWQNTFAYGPVSVTATTYFTDGYQLEAEDVGGVTGVCISGGASASPANAVYQDGITPVECKVKPFWDVDLHASYDFDRHFQFYLDVSNLFNKPAPLDAMTYGGDNYNPAWANDGIYGRYFKVGLKATF